MTEKKSTENLEIALDAVLAKIEVDNSGKELTDNKSIAVGAIKDLIKSYLLNQDLPRGKYGEKRKLKDWSPGIIGIIGLETWEEVFGKDDYIYYRSNLAAELVLIREKNADGKLSGTVPLRSLSNKIILIGGEDEWMRAETGAERLKGFVQALFSNQISIMVTGEQTSAAPENNSLLLPLVIG